MAKGDSPLRFAFCFPMATGHINPSLPIARSLVNLGHEVHYMSRKEMEPLIQQTGASFTDVATQQTELYEGRETDIMGCFRSLSQEMGNPTDAPMLVGLLRTAPRHMELQMPGTIRWMQKIQPHVVLFCPFMNAEAVYAAKYLQIPAVGLWTFAGPGSMVPLVDSFLMQSGNMEVAEILRQAREFEPMMEAIRNVEEKYGFQLDLRGFLEPKGFLPVFCETRYNLVTTGADLQDPLPEELAKLYQGTAKFITVGPLLQDAPETVTTEAQEILKEIRDAREAGRKVILVSMGTILTSDTTDVGWHTVPRDGSEIPRGITGKQLCHSAWGAAFEAFGVTGDDTSDAPLLVVAVGSQPDALEDLPVPKNAKCYPYLPQVEILKAGVDLFLTHGGQNSFMESLMAGTPVVVCPGFADQIANAMRAEMSGVGLQIPRPVPPHGEELSAMATYRAAVAAALHRVLNESHFTEMTQQIGQKLRQEGGVPRAVELLLETAQEARPTLLGQPRAEVLTKEKAAVPGSEAAQV